MFLFAHHLQFTCETVRVCNVAYSQEHAASWRRIIPSRVASCRGCRPNAPYIDHFVWAYLFENPVQAAPAGPLLCYEGNCRRARFRRPPDLVGNMQQRLTTKPITHGRPRPTLAYRKVLAL